LSVSVDFAKHGVCVNKDAVQNFQVQAGKYPNFIESSTIYDKDRRQSVQILGKLFAEAKYD
jgi:hypothetical protein